MSREKFIVERSQVEDVFFEIECHGFLGLDTETTGLNPYKGDRLFSLIISTYNADYYFNFNETPDHMGVTAPSHKILDRSIVFKKLRNILKNSDITIFIHNAKFDMHFLYHEGVRTFKSRIICTWAAARLVNNQLHSYSLDNLGKQIGFEKDDTVEKYISKHKLYTLEDVGKKKPKKNKHYNLVPFDIIVEYGMQDGHVVFELGKYILLRLKELDDEQTEMGLPSIFIAFENEIRLTKTLYKMEQVGIKVDLEYCKQAYEYEKSNYIDAENQFYALTEIEFDDSAACFKKAFNKLGLTAGKTAKGRDSYSADNLPDNEVTAIILKYRHHYKRATTYFKNFIDLADTNGVIHCSFNQAGTSTGRLSAKDPNLQNVPKRGEDDAAFPVRKAFVPREGYTFVMQDADAGEYKLLLDLANEPKVIQQIEEGLDVHTATAKEMGVSRTDAKTLNFMLLYGGGAQKLADALGISLQKAKIMKNKYFQVLPQVQKLVNGIKFVSKTRGYIINWLGRRLLCPSGTDYKMPNAYIQGGLGDIVKCAMNNVDQYIIDHKLDTNILLNIHDEILYEVPSNELSKVKDLENILVQSYPYKNLKLTWGTDVGDNWYDKRSYED